MAVVTPLRRAQPPDDEENERVNVVRLVQFLGPVSPELALVDPELRERARALMPDVPGIRVPRRRQIEEPRVAIVSVPARKANGWRLATVSVLVAAGVASFGFGFLLAADAESEPSLGSRTPTSPTTAKSTAPPVTKTTPAAPTVAEDAPVVTAPRFVWAPEPGAVGYRVALYRDERLIFEQDVTKPVLVLSSTWTHDGRVQRLTRGPYRWLVWALLRNGDSVRRGRAIVSAQYVAS
jgi:hypothetical protein